MRTSVAQEFGQWLCYCGWENRGAGIIHKGTVILWWYLYLFHNYATHKLKFIGYQHGMSLTGSVLILKIVIG